MDLIALSFAAVTGTIIVWFVLRHAGQGYRHYRQVLTSQAVDRLNDFFVFLDPAQLWVANLVACMVLALASYVLTEAILLTAATAIAALLAPQYVLRSVRRRRGQRFDEQLPDLLMALASALRAGSGLQSALRHIVAQSPAPLAQEFGFMLRQQRMGVAFDQALADLYGRMPSEGTSLVVSSLTIAAHSGGGLAEALERIAATLRARLHLLGRVHALTSQGRLQAWVMACLPLLLAVVLQRLDPESMQSLWSTPAGWAVIALIALLETVGIVLILRIVNIQV
ncbi:type II secretion system F family protein [Pollutimonas thiosulfatoxidans]|uniref:Pilus assembly protein n=1 Tax=Pollutimonas thiosulfatoxidans TaxID=2028345 RepID=A0A410GAC3_9BURK|nr:type II secretion system F family protein [Pollutimonas thiosulfatoxidans]MBF6617307.1 type II secretion system F family protein [Candidimonas sp.]QAA93258.1 pilus assembly protein [Pollutimonas thiosulfatoxidans]